MKKFLCVVLTLVLLVSVLAGCSSKSDELVGTWEGQIDMTDMVNEQLGAEFAGMFTLDDMVFTMSITFNKDGTYQVNLDRESVEAAFNGMVDDMKDGLIDMLEAEIAAMGVDMSVEDMLAASGMDMDQLMEEALAEVDMDSLIDGVMAESSFSGNYKAKDGKLFLSDGLDYQPDPEIYELYSVSGNTLTLTDPGLSDSAFVGLYPVVFQKVA